MCYLIPEQASDSIDLFSVDVSFTSPTLVLPVARTFPSGDVRALCLIESQFEARRKNVGKGGVICGQAVHKQVIVKIRDFVLAYGFSILGLAFSPVKGSEENIEYLIYLQRSEYSEDASGQSVPDSVGQSHIELDGGDTY